MRRYTKRRQYPNVSAIQRRRRGPFKKGYQRTAGLYGRFQSRAPQENKFHDVAISINTGTAKFSQLAEFLKIAQDTTQSTRIGRKLVVNRVTFKLQLKDNYAPSNTATAEAGSINQWRIILFLDTQNNGAMAGADLDDLLDDATNIHSFNALSNSLRFRVIKSWSGIFRNQVPGGAAETDMQLVGSKMIVKSFKMNLPMDYSSTVGALTEIASNNLILGVQCQNGTATTAPGVTLTGRARVRFKG